VVLAGLVSLTPPAFSDPGRPATQDQLCYISGVLAITMLFLYYRLKFVFFFYPATVAGLDQVIFVGELGTCKFDLRFSDVSDVTACKFDLRFSDVSDVTGPLPGAD